jgi:hypothetical protein
MQEAWSLIPSTTKTKVIAGIEALIEARIIRGCQNRWGKWSPAYFHRNYSQDICTGSRFLQISEYLHGAK